MLFVQGLPDGLGEADGGLGQDLRGLADARLAVARHQRRQGADAVIDVVQLEEPRVVGDRGDERLGRVGLDVHGRHRGRQVGEHVSQLQAAGDGVFLAERPGFPMRAAMRWIRSGATTALAGRVSSTGG